MNNSSNNSNNKVGHHSHTSSSAAIMNATIHNSSNSGEHAFRSSGVCTGNLWIHYDSTTDASKLSSKRPKRECVHGVLVGVSLATYADRASYLRGDHPMSLVRIVGASAWNDHSRIASAGSTSNNGGGESSSSTSTTTDTSFRLVTAQGTHIYCTTPSDSDRNVWLASLHAGLEASFSTTTGSATTSTTMTTANTCSISDQTLPPLLPPSPKVRVSSSTSRSSQHHHRPYCRSCGKLAYASLVVLEGTPLPQYGMEGRRHICPLCSLAQGVLMEIQNRTHLYQYQCFQQDALNKAKQLCWSCVVVDIDSDDGSSSDAANKDSATNKLLDMVSSQSFGSFRRVCPWLDEQCRLLEHGQLPLQAFVEMLEASTSSTRGKEQEELADLKKQAFRVAGDMASAIRLLHSCAAAATTNSSSSSASSNNNTTDDDMLSYVLEFFLDLCDEGELSSVAFFWPQLQCIHLRMLPPSNAHELKNVELMEDFLLTVCCKYSVHLALELVWNYAADLEDSLYNPNCDASCRRRRFAVVRFVCELESLLFDFEHGWGGGSVALKNMLTPSPHQVTLLRLAVMQLQDCRLQAGADGSSNRACLSRSVRRDKLTHSKFSLPPEEAAQEALRIARNADYFSSHLSYIRRLGDIAEKLRHQMDVSERPAMLERELSLLNSSGGMGGDPLNRIHDNLMRVVRVPRREGHVFRSKERTPVLLLMEVLEEGAEEEEDSIASPALAPETAKEGIYSNGSGKESAGEDTGNESEQAHGEDTGESQSDPNDGSDISVDDSVEASSTQSFSTPRESEDAENDGSAKRQPESVQGAPETTDIVVVADTGDVEGAPLDNRKHGNRAATKSEKSNDTGTEGKDESGNKKGNARTDDIYSDPLKSLDSEMMSELHHHSPRALGKLKHFDMSPRVAAATPATPSKKCVEEIVNTVLIEQLDIPDLSGKKPADGDESEAQTEESNLRTSRLSSSPSGRRMSALGADLGDSTSSLPSDEIRREVLTAIMMKGKRGASDIASVAASAARKSLQDLDRKRAVDLILHGGEVESPNRSVPQGAERKVKETEAARRKLLELGLDQAVIAETLEEEPGVGIPSEEDEAMEALRLILLQNRVGQGTMSAETAAMAMAQPSGSSVMNISLQRDRDIRGDRTGKVDKSEMIEIDAGDVDSRLSGCGPLPPAVLSALTLWKAEVVSTGELLELVKKDLDYIRLINEESTDKLIEDSQFWGRFAYGERWAEKKARLSALSPNGTDPGWDLLGVIVKSNDDLRQEAFVMQLIELCDEAFQIAGLDLWLHPYRILATGRTTGVIEMVKNAMSFDALKKRPGYGRGGLREHLKRMTEFTADPSESFRCAQRNFVSSLAAYSLLSYFFLFKDRHNGNILLDTVGHVIHIDFGFVFGVAPGGSFSLEMSTPFKLTEEMMEVMGGMESPLFSEFVTLFCCGFLALQAHVDTFATVVEITCRGSSFKCFEGRDADEVVAKLRERFVADFSKETTVAYALDLIKQATKSYGTKQYDYFQYLSQGIAA